MGASGTSGDGTVLRYDVGNNLVQLPHTFTGSDGAGPQGAPLLVGSTLYGQTNGGGTGAYGVVFAIATPEPTSFVLAAIALPGLALLAARKRPAACAPAGAFSAPGR